MSYQIEIKLSVRKALLVMPKNVQHRINTAIDSLKDNPRCVGSRKLSGYENLYRFRVGDYRIIYEIHDDKLIIIIIKIGHRREIYR